MSEFIVHDIDSAPEGARDGLRAAEKNLGFVPNMMSVLAESPAALEAYQGISAVFAKSSFSAAEQPFLALVVSVANGCTYCVPAYTALSLKAGVASDVVDAVRDGTAITDGRLSALRQFTLALIDKQGRVAGAEVDAFLAAGFTKAQVFEVIVAAAFKLISNYANHITGMPLDEVFQPFSWQEGKTG